MHLNKLSINLAKTESMVISNRKIDQLFKLTLEENQITLKSSIKYLGDVIDDKLSWKQQKRNAQKFLKNPGQCIEWKIMLTITPYALYILQ